MGNENSSFRNNVEEVFPSKVSGIAYLKDDLELRKKVLQVYFYFPYSMIAIFDRDEETYQWKILTLQKYNDEPSNLEKQPNLGNIWFQKIWVDSLYYRLESESLIPHDQLNEFLKNKQ